MDRHILYGVLLTALCVCGSPSKAQHSSDLSSYNQQAAAIVERYKKELLQGRGIEKKMMQDSADVVVSPYMFKLLGPGVYYSSALKKNFELDYELPTEGAKEVASRAMDERNSINTLIDKALVNAYVGAPTAFRYSDSQIESEVLVSSEPVANAKPEDLEAIYKKA